MVRSPSASPPAIEYLIDKEYIARSDESRNGSFLAYGRQLVGGLPRGAVLMVNDDLNCNLPHYVLRCEPWFRPDVQLVRLPLITYEWWRRMQLHHYTRTQDVNMLPQTTHTVLDEEGGGLAPASKSVETAATVSARRDRRRAESKKRPRSRKRSGGSERI